MSAGHGQLIRRDLQASERVDASGDPSKDPGEPGVKPKTFPGETPREPRDPGGKTKRSTRGAPGGLGNPGGAER